MWDELAHICRKVFHRIWIEPKIHAASFNNPNFTNDLPPPLPPPPVNLTHTEDQNSHNDFTTISKPFRAESFFCEEDAVAGIFSMTGDEEDLDEDAYRQVIVTYPAMPRISVASNR